MHSATSRSGARQSEPDCPGLETMLIIGRRHNAPPPKELMKENSEKSDDLRISALLREARLTPDLPPRFQENVWRRIEGAAAPAKSGSWLVAMANLILRPRFALAAAAILLLAGVLAGTIQGRQAVRHDAEMNYIESVVPHAVH